MPFIVGKDHVCTVNLENQTFVIKIFMLKNFRGATPPTKLFLHRNFLAVHVDL